MLATPRPEGGWSFHPDGPDLDEAPGFSLRSEQSAYAFGFGCPLARLGFLGPSNRIDTPELLPPLPNPTEIWTWDGEGEWRESAALTSLPPDLRSLFPGDGPPPCESYIARPEFEQVRRQEFALEPGEFGSPLVQAASDVDGGLIVLQPVISFSEGARVVARGRFFRRLPEEENLRPFSPAGNPPDRALASRGDGKLVLAGPSGLISGDFRSGFSNSTPIPAFAGAGDLRLAVSPHDEPLEVFALVHDPEPLNPTERSTLSFVYLDTEGHRLLAEFEVRGRGDGALNAPTIVRRASGQALATGFSEVGQILELGPTQARLRTLTGAGIPVSLAQHPAAGILLVDDRGSTFLLPPEAPVEGGWVRVPGEPADLGLVAAAQLGPSTVFAVYNAGEEGSGVRFAHLALARNGTWGVCRTEALDIRPTLQARVRWGHLVASFDERDETWWFVTAAGPQIEVSRARLRDEPGGCGRL